MRYLFFDEKRICYDSTQFFIKAMADALTDQGNECIICHMREHPDLAALTEKEFDGIFGFNSQIPTLKLGEGDYYADHLQGPFFNWLLDHPLYHHPVLAQQAKNYHVLTLDDKHTEYLKKYYPWLASVATRPLFTMPYQEEKIRPIEDRQIPLLFTGTYTPQSVLDRRMEEFPRDARRDILELAEIMEENFALSPEEAMQEFLDRRNASVSPEIFREFLCRYYLADTIVAAGTRERVITTLLNAGAPLTVCGHGWEKLDCEGRENLTILPERSYADSLDLAYEAKILLNIMPNLKAGLHDRVLTAMGHGAVCLSDETSYLTDNFTPNRDLLLYSAAKDKKSMEGLSELAEKIVSGALNLQPIADAGHRLAAARKNVW